MTFFLHDSIQPNGPLDLIDYGAGETRRRSRCTGEVPLLLEKLEVPRISGLMERERLRCLLERSRAQFPCTLVSGRAGTGKTALAASVANECSNTAWYTVETGDIDWRVFSRYFSRCLANAGFGEAETLRSDGKQSSQTVVARFLLRHFFKAEQQLMGRALIVLDDIHHIFDAEWFEEFFKLLLYSLPPDTHLILLCRSKPPAPLWRLRSKQVLNVIDEEQLAFTAAEARELFEKYGRSASEAETANEECFGRASKLIEAARS
ncbi:MAG TPA: AAA family ATPase [Pyrinomonadaceae bacterium]|nr:AAA family ATPase [Pyrinomonadaceae bacterium]